MVVSWQSTVGQVSRNLELEGAVLLLMKPRTKETWREGLFPRAFCFCGLFSQVCLLPARLPSQYYGMHLTGMFI